MKVNEREKERNGKKNKESGRKRDRKEEEKESERRTREKMISRWQTPNVSLNLESEWKRREIERQNEGEERK